MSLEGHVSAEDIDIHHNYGHYTYSCTHLSIVASNGLPCTYWLSLAKNNKQNVPVDSHVRHTADLFHFHLSVW